MAQSDLNVSNLALRLIGNRAILGSLSDTSTEGLACNANVDDCKRSLLRMHPWNFAVKRINLSATYTTITSLADDGSGHVRVTSAAHGKANGERVTIKDVTIVGGANGTWIVEDVAASTFDLKDSVFATGTGSANGSWTSAAAYQFAFAIALPADNLRIIKVNEETRDDWKIEKGFILTDSDDITVKYIYDVTSYPTMDVMFYQVLAHYLAYNLCDHISASDGKKQELYAYLWGGQGRRGMMPLAKFLDASEDGPEVVSATDWVESRFSGPTTSPIVGVDV